MTKPFILIIILLVIFIITNSEKQLLWRSILTSVLLMISVFFKPNFALAFVPALGVFVLFRYPGEFRKYTLSFFLVFPALLLLGYQFLSTYLLHDDKLLGTSDQVIFSFFGAWNVHSPCIPLSVLRGLIFPAAIFVFRRKKVMKNDYLTISWLFYLVAFIEVSLLAEKQSFYAFNFSNGYNFSLISLYTFSLIELLMWFKELNISVNIFVSKYKELASEQKKLYYTALFFYLGVGSGFIYLLRQILGYGFS